MVTNDERDYMYLAYAPIRGCASTSASGGGSRRSGTTTGARIELLNTLLFSFPGTPVLYYGDEIGMGDNIYLGDRNGVRTPMQWTGDRNAGFSRADPRGCTAAPIMDPVYGYQAVNVEAQQRNPSSLLHWMRRMIALRQRFGVRARHDGVPPPGEPQGPRVHPPLRGRARARASRTSRGSPSRSSSTSRAFEGYAPVEILGVQRVPADRRAPYFLTLGPYGFYWFELERPH